jgi:hypothetical protein
MRRGHVIRVMRVLMGEIVGKMSHVLKLVTCIMVVM